jgi:Leucine-rich repeat (LRR) protein
LSLNRLTGSIPGSITKLKGVVQIELYNNSLSGELPSGMSNLTSLSRFNALMNELTGAILGELCGLSLGSLNLYENRFEGSLPKNITRSAKLYELKLFNNKLSAPLPSQLGRNSPLQNVDLSYNGFYGEIPNHLCEKGALEDLLIYNLFSGKIPESLEKCQSLHRVWLKHNKVFRIEVQWTVGIFFKERGERTTRFRQTTCAI